MNIISKQQSCHSGNHKSIRFVEIFCICFIVCLSFQVSQCVEYFGNTENTNTPTLRDASTFNKAISLIQDFFSPIVMIRAVDDFNFSEGVDAAGREYLFAFDTKSGPRNFVTLFRSRAFGKIWELSNINLPVSRYQHYLLAVEKLCKNFPCWLHV